MPRNISDAEGSGIKQILNIRCYHKTESEVKTSNRYLDRNGIPQAEIFYCPVSGDVEVWHEDRYRFKFRMRPRD